MRDYVEKLMKDSADLLVSTERLRSPETRAEIWESESDRAAEMVASLKAEVSAINTVLEETRWRMWNSMSTEELKGHMEKWLQENDRRLDELEGYLQRFGYQRAETVVDEVGRVRSQLSIVEERRNVGPVEEGGDKGSQLSVATEEGQTRNGEMEKGTEAAAESAKSSRSLSENQTVHAGNLGTGEKRIVAPGRAESGITQNDDVVAVRSATCSLRIAPSKQLPPSSAHHDSRMHSNTGNMDGCDSRHLRELTTPAPKASDPFSVASTERGRGGGAAGLHRSHEEWMRGKVKSVQLEPATRLYSGISQQPLLPMSPPQSSPDITLDCLSADFLAAIRAASSRRQVESTGPCDPEDPTGKRLNSCAAELASTDKQDAVSAAEGLPASSLVAVITSSPTDGGRQAAPADSTAKHPEPESNTKGNLRSSMIPLIGDVSEEEFLEVPQYLRFRFDNFQDLNKAIGKINGCLTNKWFGMGEDDVHQIDCNVRDCITQKEIASLGLGAKEKPVMVLLMKLNRLVVEHRSGVVVYSVCCSENQNTV
ncbi:hypothetical protein CBR_g40815 [Chara braunii]|uniref:Spindle and kinetochore-associated protein 3 n=1 Tax=Chara braunii TaxID=69332 RepID=A0A388LUW2_CHABU|nr:hypothetical protein CBR_g40815 [Chara braunii]|eukprot:GBG86002.1 hypothetical protein CBR_g40815 [Chara braunii]